MIRKKFSACVLTFMLVAMVCLCLGTSSPPLSAAPPSRSTGDSSPNTPIAPHKLLVQRRTVAPSFWEDPIGWGLWAQRRMVEGLTRILKTVSQSPLQSLFLLSSLGFLYGVLHAAGPGHGKAVVSMWVLGERKHLREGIVLAILTALLQAVVAICIVSVAVVFLNWSAQQVRIVGNTLEHLSFLGISGIGVFLMGSALWALTQRAKPHACCGHGCGHAPAPPRNGSSFMANAAPLLSVGIRPCIGALTLLMLSYAFGIYWAGIIGVLAMAMGTALTVSILVALTLALRRGLLSWFERESRTILWIHASVKFVAGALLCVIGLGFFLKSGTLPPLG